MAIPTVYALLFWQHISEQQLDLEWEMRNLLILLGLTITTSVHAQDANNCDAIINHGLSNVYESVSYSAYADSVHDRYCSYSYESLDKDTKTSLGVVFKKIKFNFSNNGASTKVKHEEFCRNYKRQTDNTNINFNRARVLHNRAIQAWEQCISMAGQKTFIEANFPDGKKELSVRISYLGPAPSGIEFMGVDASNMSCKSQGQEVKANESKFIKAENPITISCSRDSRIFSIAGRESTYYPEAYLTVKTAADNLNINFVEMLGSPAEDRFQSIEANLASLQDKLENSGYIKACRVCFTSRGRQCTNQTNKCSPWSTSPGFSAAHYDDTDGGDGGCHTSWKLECR